MRTAILLFVICLIVAACTSKSDKKNIVARVGEKELTWNEVMNIVPDNSSSVDSTTLANRYINDWLHQQVVLQQAEKNLGEEKMNFDELIENYRRTLLIYTYEQELVKQQLDTNISEKEIEDYYNNHLENFQLRDYIVKVKYCAIDAESRQIKALKKLMFSSDPSDLVKWEKFCVDNGASHYFDEDHWMLWDEFVQQIPITVVDKDAFLRKNRQLEFEKDNNLYLVSIVDFQVSGSQSPLSFEKEKIREMILNKRKQDLLSRMREDLYQQALQSKTIETFDKK
jgi:hypothetical protein